MTKIKKLLALCLAAACSVSLTACSQQSSSSEASSQLSAAGTSSQAPAQTDQQGSASSAASDQDVVYGKVTAVDGSKITIALGTLNFQERGGSGGSRPQGTSSGSGQEAGSRPAGSRPSGNQQGQRGNFSNLLTLTGKSTTITISDASVLKKQEMSTGGGRNRTDSGAPSGTAPSGSGAPSGTAPTGSGTPSGTAPSGGGNHGGEAKTSQASLSDVKTGDILKVTTQKSDGKLVSVLIMGEPANR